MHICIILQKIVPTVMLTSIFEDPSIGSKLIIYGAFENLVNTKFSSSSDVIVLTRLQFKNIFLI